MIYTLKRKVWLYRYAVGETFVGSTCRPKHEAEKGDRFRLVGWHNGYALLCKLRGVDHGKLYAAPNSWLKNMDMWWEAGEAET